MSVAVGMKSRSGAIPRMSGAVVPAAIVRQHRAKGANSRITGPRMKEGDALAFILIAVLALPFAVSIKAPELLELLATIGR